VRPEFLVPLGQSPKKRLKPTASTVLVVGRRNQEMVGADYVRLVLSIAVALLIPLVVYARWV
jgi:hypothetical protein